MLLPRLMSTGVVNKMEFLTGHEQYLLFIGYQFSTEMAEYWDKDKGMWVTRIQGTDNF